MDMSLQACSKACRSSKHFWYANNARLGLDHGSKGSKLEIKIPLFFLQTLNFFANFFFAEIRVERFVFSRSDWISVSHKTFSKNKSSFEKNQV